MKMSRKDKEQIKENTEEIKQEELEQTTEGVVVEETETKGETVETESDTVKTESDTVDATEPEVQTEEEKELEDVVEDKPEENTEEIKQEENKTEDKEANVMVELYGKQYSVAEMNALKRKENKTYNEKNLCNRYDEEMKNLYQMIEHAATNGLSMRRLSPDELVKVLDYETVERRCGRRFFKFDKDGVDAVIKYMKEN